MQEKYIIFDAIRDLISAGTYDLELEAQEYSAAFNMAYTLLSPEQRQLLAKQYLIRVYNTEFSPYLKEGTQEPFTPEVKQLIHALEESSGGDNDSLRAG